MRDEIINSMSSCISPEKDNGQTDSERTTEIECGEWWWWESGSWIDESLNNPCIQDWDFSKRFFVTEPFQYLSFVFISRGAGVGVVSCSWAITCNGQSAGEFTGGGRHQGVRVQKVRLLNYWYDWRGGSSLCDLVAPRERRRIGVTIIENGR